MITDKINEILNSCLVQTSNKEPENGKPNSKQETLKSSLELNRSPKTALPFIDPSNREKFEERVCSFKPELWFLKPTELSPRYIARYGWRCASKDILQCTFCKSYVSAHLPSASKVKLYLKCKEVLLNKVINGHRPGCLWAVRPSPEDLSGIETVEEMWPRFLKVVSDLSKLENNLPVISAEFPSELQEVCGVLVQCIPELSDYRCILLAASGWSKQNSRLPGLSCQLCNRNVGCWNFKTGSADSAAQFENILHEQTSLINQDGDQQSETAVVLVNDQDALSEFLVFREPKKTEDESNNFIEEVVELSKTASTSLDEGNSSACLMQHCKTGEEQLENIKEMKVTKEISNSSADPEKPDVLFGHKDLSVEPEKETFPKDLKMSGVKKQTPDAEPANIKSNKTTADNLSGNDSKRRRIELGAFNPLKQHWNWCFWVTSQKHCKQEIEGWRLHAYLLMENFQKISCRSEAGAWRNDDRFSSVINGLRSIRELLNI